MRTDRLRFHYTLTIAFTAPITALLTWRKFDQTINGDIQVLV